MVGNHKLTDNDLISPLKIPDYILEKLMILNCHAREFKLKPLTKNKDLEGDKEKDLDEKDLDEDIFETKDSNSRNSQNTLDVHPMDGMLWVFHCSDIYLRRSISVKLSACQLSVPFLLPDPAAPSENVTILLSALQNITKSWKYPSGDYDVSTEVYATEYPFPVVSFIRIGEVSMSKSSLINKIMSDVNGDHNFFFHKNIQGGDVERKVVDGLVELCWYLPEGSEKQSLQYQICFANLRGDATRFKKQLDLLLKISPVFCILLNSDCPNEKVTNILEEMTNIAAKIIIILKDKIRNEDAIKYFKELKSKCHEKLYLISSLTAGNEYSFLEKIRENLQKCLQETEGITRLGELASCSHEPGIHLDSHQLPFKGRWESSLDTWLKQDLKDAKNHLKLQMHVPVLADLEREKYSPKRPIEKILKDIQTEEEAQQKSFAQLDKNVLNFLNSLPQMDKFQRDYAINKVKHQLDKMSLQVMAKIHQEHRINLVNETPQQSLRLAAEESKYSFGLEHVIRELAQLYQLQVANSQNDYADAAAEILLSGQPLELLDGNSSYIPLRWFDAVYSNLEHKTNNAKIFVISVLGIQSSGKSTMLNTMFGLEFPVSAGSCTRGAFASLIPVSDSLKSESNVQYLLIIDTEGLKASADPQLREHDNELATFAIGVADLTIVNIYGENHHEIKEFLQIAVHAFLKMRLLEEIKTCKIVHQNVAATDAMDKLKSARSNLKQDLDEMTKLAATQENCESTIQKLDDIISFNENEDVFYVPSLLKGSPPMAPVNPSYGKTVQKIKDNIIKSMKSRAEVQQSISQFRWRVTNLWKSMLKENFIFSFRNVLEVRAYTTLDRKYFGEFVSILVTGMTELETETQLTLKRCETQVERVQIWDEMKEKEIPKKAKEISKKFEEAMVSFFKTDPDRIILEQWRKGWMMKIPDDIKTQKSGVIEHCQATFDHLQSLQQVEEEKQSYRKELLHRAEQFMTAAHNTKDPENCKVAFEQEWKQWILKVPECKEERNDVNDEMLNVLSDTDPTLNTEMSSKLKVHILHFIEMFPVINFNQLDISKSEKVKGYVQDQKEQHVDNARRIVREVVDDALKFIEQKSNSGGRCTRNDLTQLYQEIIVNIEEKQKKFPFKFNKNLKCEILLYTFARSYETFNGMEKRYIQERDIRGLLEKDLRPSLERFFLDTCKDVEKEVSVANSIVDVLKKPIEEKLIQAMGPAVANEIIKDSEFQSKDKFQARVLIQLGEKAEFAPYIPYLGDPVGFLKIKLIESIEKWCLGRGVSQITSLIEKEIKSIESKVYAAISTASALTETKESKLVLWISEFVKECRALEITTEMFFVAEICVDINPKNFERFDSNVRENVANFCESLVKRAVDSESVKQWNPSLQDNLVSVFGCEALCPFCKILCDHSVKNHGGYHSSRTHRSQGIAGYRHECTEKSTLHICTAMMDIKNAKFRNSDTSNKWHKYRKYESVNDYYKSWSFAYDPSCESSTYWQWFMAKFSKELAKHHNCKEPDISSTWKKHTFKEVKVQLLQKYDML
jgi:hypothetical protein